jgi:hypothetical protein
MPGTESLSAELPGAMCSPASVSDSFSECQLLPSLCDRQVVTGEVMNPLDFPGEGNRHFSTETGQNSSENGKLTHIRFS